LTVRASTTFVIDYGEDPQAQEKPSKQFREQFGHTPLSIKDMQPARDWRGLSMADYQ